MMQECIIRERLEQIVDFPGPVPTMHEYIIQKKVEQVVDAPVAQQHDSIVRVPIIQQTVEQIVDDDRGALGPRSRRTTFRSLMPLAS